jgi:hypothetical protein
MGLKSHRPIVGGLAIGCIALVAGCGGGTSSSALSPEEYRTQADAICTTFDTAQNAVAEPTSPETIAPYFEKLLPLATKRTAELKALKVPDELKATHDEAIGLEEQQLAILTDAKKRIDGGESSVAVVTEIQSKVTPLSDKSDALAKELGLKVCGKDDSTTTTSTTATAPVLTTATTQTETTDTTATTSASPTGEVDATVFAGDVQKLGGNLTQFGLTLQAAAQGPAALAERSTLLRTQLDEFDTIIGRMDGYTVSTPELESRRAAIVASGPDVTSSGRELLDAADAGDASKLNAILPKFTSALTKLQTAATGG